MKYGMGMFVLGFKSRFGPVADYFKDGVLDVFVIFLLSDDISKIGLGFSVQTSDHIPCCGYA